MSFIKNSPTPQEQGFTLIEILVVILIIGILAAIAIPVFLNQKQAAIDASLQSDIKQMINAQMDWVAKNPQGYGSQMGSQMAIREPDTTNVSGSHNTDGIAFKPSPGNYIKVPYTLDPVDNKPSGICIVTWNANSTKYKTEATGMRWSSATGQYGGC
jgi:prepilin-type N-terminal cleavage/methylation domain-containing protein